MVRCHRSPVSLGFSSNQFATSRNSRRSMVAISSDSPGNVQFDAADIVAPLAILVA